MMKPDYAKLQLKGNGHRQDSFVLAVQAAAQLFGKEIDYDTLTCLAGNAFAPFRNLTEDCTSHCQLEAVYSDRAMATVAGYVGLRARKLELPPFEGFDVKDADRPAYLATVAKAVRGAMDAGEVVIALQGWQVKGGPHGFTHWGYAGIVTEADPATGKILGAHLNGHKDNPIYHGAVMWAVAPGEVTLKSPAAERVMLRQAVDYIRGQGLFAPKEPVVYGLAAMDAWIKHMQTVKGYCALCYGRGQQSWHDAMENGERLSRGARVAAKKLRSLGPQCESVAKHYDRIVELLAPVKYQEFIGDLDKQKAHAENVLIAVKAELAAAAGEMEKALAKIQPPERAELLPSPLIQVPPGTRPEIECPPGPGVLRALMEFIGEDFGFSTNRANNTTWRTNECFPLFAALYGDAFRFVWLPSEGKPMPDGGLAILDDQPERFLACLDAAGFQATAAARPGLCPVPPPFAWDEATLRRAIVKSIVERQWPVVLVGQPKPEWASVITGFEKNGAVLTGWCVEGGDDRGIRFEPAKRQMFTDWFPNVRQIVLLTDRRVRPPATVTYRMALKRATTELRATAFGAFHAGPATFEAWAKQLEDPALSEDDAETNQKRKRIVDPMIWDLATRRHYGSVFMRRAAQVFPAAADELNAAGKAFTAIHDAMWEINRLGGGKHPGSPLPKLIDPAVRKQIAEIILQCRDHDLDAAKKIESALQHP